MHKTARQAIFCLFSLLLCTSKFGNQHVAHPSPSPIAADQPMLNSFSYETTIEQSHGLQLTNEGPPQDFSSSHANSRAVAISNGSTTAVPQPAASTISNGLSSSTKPDMANSPQAKVSGETADMPSNPQAKVSGETADMANSPQAKVSGETADMANSPQAKVSGETADMANSPQAKVSGETADMPSNPQAKVSGEVVPPAQVKPPQIRIVTPRVAKISKPAVVSNPAPTMVATTVEESKEGEAKVDNPYEVKSTSFSLSSGSEGMHVTQEASSYQHLTMENISKSVGMSTDLAAQFNKNKQLNKMRLLASYISENYKISLEAAEHIVLNSFQESDKHEIEPLLILSLIGVESTYRQYTRSHMGAIGLTQVMPVYHKQKINELKAQNLDIWSVKGNIQLGARILKEYIVLAQGNIQKALQMYSGGINDANKSYSKKVFAKMQNLHSVVAK